MKQKRKTKRVVLSKDRATELFVGGLTGCLSLADQLGLKATAGAALMSALHLAMPQLSVEGLAKAHKRLGGELPAVVRAKLRKRALGQ